MTIQHWRDGPAARDARQGHRIVSRAHCQERAVRIETDSSGHQLLVTCIRHTYAAHGLYPMTALPNFHDPLVPCRRQEFPVRAEGQGPDAVLLGHDGSPQLPATGEVPKNQLRVPSRSHSRAIGTAGQTPDRGTVSFDGRPESPASIQVPENDGSIQASGHQHLAARSISQAADLPIMTGQRLAVELPAGDIPLQHVTKLATGSEESAVRTEGNVG